MARSSRAILRLIAVTLVASTVDAQAPQSAAPSAPPARSQAVGRWTEIGKTSTGNLVYVDRRSIVRTDSIITATVRVVYTEPVATPQGPITGSRSVAMFNCATKRVAVKESIIWHDEKKGTIYRKSAPVRPGFGPALTSTFAFVAMEYLCKDDRR